MPPRSVMIVTFRAAMESSESLTTAARIPRVISISRGAPDCSCAVGGESGILGDGAGAIAVAEEWFECSGVERLASLASCASCADASEPCVPDERADVG